MKFIVCCNKHGETRHQENQQCTAFSKNLVKTIDQVFVIAVRPSSIVVDEENIELVKSLIEIENRLSTIKISQMLDISHGSVHTILRDKLLMRSVCSRWIPKDLTDGQKMARVEKARELHDFLSSDFNLEKVYWTDEKWFHLRSVGTKQTNRAWCAPGDKRPTATRRSQSEKKSCYCCSKFWRPLLFRKRGT